jgi:hypothetical protein
MASLGCVVALLALLVGCDIGGDTCAGSQHGDVTLYASQQGEDPSRALPGGGSAFVHRVDFDTDPATVSIGIAVTRRPRRGKSISPSVTRSRCQERRTPLSASARPRPTCGSPTRTGDRSGSTRIVGIA